MNIWLQISAFLLLIGDGFSFHHSLRRQSNSFGVIPPQELHITHPHKSWINNHCRELTRLHMVHPPLGSSYPQPDDPDHAVEHLEKVRPKEFTRRIG
jgi:hypothetical protein